MALSIKEFEKEFILAIQEGTAAIFAGAGISRPSGFVDWQQLMSSIAQSIGLDSKKETDFAAVAQYYVNDRRNRSGINSLISNHFVKYAKLNPLVSIITKLPINTYWTTNYDRLLEDSFEKQHRICDVKISPDSVSVASQNADVTLYKMHGDCRQPEQCVLTKEDYEVYDRERHIFVTTLQAHLVTKTFLFVGFSFDDPNLYHILSRVRVLLGENIRTHYCFFEKVKSIDGEKSEETEYRKTKQDLRIEDLKRYGICAVLVDSYQEIPRVLEHIYLQAKVKNVFISGAAHDYGAIWQNTGTKFIRELTQMLYDNDYKIVTGHARGVGSFVISTILQNTQSNIRLLESHLDIKAFPYEEKGAVDYDKKKKDYRHGIAEKVGVSIFIFGNREELNGEKSNITLASGMWDEYEAAREAHNYIIPVGSTGYMAQKIYDDVVCNKDEYGYLTSENLNILGSCTNSKTLVHEIERILERIKNM